MSLTVNRNCSIKTPVLFLVFNRPDTTRKVFEAIRSAKPQRLYVAGDGPRPNREGETDLVNVVRQIATAVDWECEVKTLFRDENLGCKYAVSEGITWFFENEEQGIILEDDCLPSQSFFRYCEELLHKYKDEESIYLVSGDSRGCESFEMKEDYGFCKYPMIWGWASWSRVWKNYDSELKDWPKQRETLLSSVSSYKPTVRFWKTIFNRMYKNKIDTWDYQFCYLLLKNKGKCIVPKVNLITNLGFGADATHTFNSQCESANRERFEINFPLNHSPHPESEIKINDFFDRNVFSSKFFILRVINKLVKLTIGKYNFQ